MFLKNLIDYYFIKRSDYFDPNYYLLNYPDVRRADIDPLWHYCLFGWKEGRNPSVKFDTKFYLQMYPDIRNAEVNPLVHYVRNGKSEQRLCRQADIDIALAVAAKDFHPHVTVIVPNYNHAPYLEKRLASIYEQTYTNFDVLLLDDNSSDGSRKILEKYQAKYPEITKTIFNDVNSGSPFRQWRNGIVHAAGDLVWIAESDDFCDTDFLEKLVPYFSDESVLLAYAHHVFVNKKGDRHEFAFETYLSKVNRHKWEASYVESAHNEVRSALGILNSIPNVGAAVFRRPPANSPFLNDPYWLDMKVCGDWLFYLNLIRGGRIGYCSETNSYYRIYDESASKGTHTRDIYYQEHEQIACTVASLYNMSDELLRQHYLRIKDYYLQTVPDKNLERFEQLYDINKVMNCKQKRTPNILIVTYAITIGGGEIFPIRLTNELKENGHSITLFNGVGQATIPDVRKSLSPLVPVINYNPSMNVGAMLTDFGIEIVHTHHASMESLFASVKVQQQSKFTHVATQNGMYEMMGEAFNRNTREILLSVDHWFYTADKNLAPFTERNLFDPQKFTKIDNGMKVPVIHPVDLGTLGIQDKSFVFCLASRAIVEKGWIEAIKAVTRAREITGKPIDLILIGEGPVYTQLLEKKLPPYIHLLGYQSNVIDFFSMSYAGLLPSYFLGESFPNVMIECYLAGKPIIASNIGEVRSMMSMDGQIKSGIMIERKQGKVDADDLADAIIRMINDQAFYESCANAARALCGRFNIERIAEEYVGWYQKILARS